MKKLTLLTSVLLVSNVFAGGDIAPIIEEPIVQVPEVIVDESAFYLGLGYGLLNQTSENIVTDLVSGCDIEYELNTVMIQAGYKYNQYLALEGRYWYGIGDITKTELKTERKESGDYTAWGIYLKPMYPVMESLNIYALIGYASVELASDNGEFWDTDTLSAGVGAEYLIMDNLSIFADYVMMGNNDEFDIASPTGHGTADIAIYTINAGLTYSF